VKKYRVPEAAWKVGEGFLAGISEGQFKEQCDVKVVLQSSYMYIAIYIYMYIYIYL